MCFHDATQIMQNKTAFIMLLKWLESSCDVFDLKHLKNMNFFVSYFLFIKK